MPSSVSSSDRAIVVKDATSIPPGMQSATLLEAGGIGGRVTASFVREIASFAKASLGCALLSKVRAEKLKAVIESAADMVFWRSLVAFGQIPM